MIRVKHVVEVEVGAVGVIGAVLIVLGLIAFMVSIA